MLQHWIVAEVRRAVPRSKDEWDSQRPKDYRHRCDTLSSETHIQDRRVRAHLPKQFEGRSNGTCWPEDMVSGVRERVLEFERYQGLIFNDEDLARASHRHGTFQLSRSLCVQRRRQTNP